MITILLRLTTCCSPGFWCCSDDVNYCTCRRGGSWKQLNTHTRAKQNSSTVCRLVSMTRNWLSPGKATWIFRGRNSNGAIKLKKEVDHRTVNTDNCTDGAVLLMSITVWSFTVSMMIILHLMMINVQLQSITVQLMMITMTVVHTLPITAQLMLRSLYIVYVVITTCEDDADCVAGEGGWHIVMTACEDDAV